MTNEHRTGPDSPSWHHQPTGRRYLAWSPSLTLVASLGALIGCGDPATSRARVAMEPLANTHDGSSAIPAETAPTSAALVASGTPLDAETVLNTLDAKSADYRARMSAHLERSFVVALRMGADGSSQPAEEGDATTYTGYADMAAVERYRATQDADALAEVERYTDAILSAQDATGIPGIIGRFVEDDGTPLLTSASLSSKDVFTTAVSALSVAYPLLSGDRQLRVQASVRAIAEEFLAERSAKPKYSFAGTYLGAGTRNPSQSDGDKVFVSFGPSLTLAHVRFIEESAPEQLQSLATTLDMLRKAANDVDDGRSIVHQVIEILLKQCDSLQQVSDGDLRRIDDFVTNAADFVQSLRGRGRFGGPEVQAQIASFVEAFVAEAQGDGNFTAVFTQYWSTGVPALVNLTTSLLRQVPDAVPPLFALLKDVLGGDDAVYGWLEDTLAGKPDDRLKSTGAAYAKRWAWSYAQCLLFRRNLDGLDRFGRRFDRKFLQPIGRGKLDIFAKNVATNVKQNVGGVVNVVQNVVKSAGNAIKKIGKKLHFLVLTPEQAQTYREERAKAIVNALRAFRSHEAQSTAALRDFLALLPSTITQPEDLLVDPGDGTLQGLAVLKVAQQITGDERFATEYQAVADAWLRLNLSFGTALDRLVTLTLGDEYRDALEIPGTHALEWTALSTLARLESDTTLRGRILDIVRDKYSYQQDEKNAWVDLIVARATGTPPGAETVNDLLAFPGHDVPSPDYCSLPDSSFPGFCSEDSSAILAEFGGYISFLAGPGTQGSRLALPLDRRPRDAFTWQRSPRRLTNGNEFVFAGVDFELAYWMARSDGVVTTCGPLCAPVACAEPNSVHTRPTLIGVRSLGSGAARGVAVSCASGSLGIAAQDGSTGIAQSLALQQSQPLWTARQEGLDYRGVALTTDPSPRLAFAGIAARGHCGASDEVGDPEGKSAISVFDGADGSNIACNSQTLFPYSGYEQNLAVAATSGALFTTGGFETCGFGNYVNVLSQFDTTGRPVARTTEPGVDFTGYDCIGSSIGRAVSAATAGGVFVAGQSALESEAGSQGFVARFDASARTWKTRSAAATDLDGVATDATGVFVAGTCAGQPCVEKYDVTTGGLAWTRTFSFAGSLQAIVAPNNGRAYATGTISGPGGSDLVLLSIDGQTGQELTRDTFGMDGSDGGRALATSGQELFVLGDTVTDSATEVFLLRYGLTAE